MSVRDRSGYYHIADIHYSKDGPAWQLPDNDSKTKIEVFYCLIVRKACRKPKNEQT